MFLVVSLQIFLIIQPGYDRKVLFLKSRHLIYVKNKPITNVHSYLSILIRENNSKFQVIFHIKMAYLQEIHPEIFFAIPRPGGIAKIEDSEETPTTTSKITTKSSKATVRSSKSTKSSSGRRSLFDGDLWVFSYKSNTWPAV